MEDGRYETPDIIEMNMGKSKMQFLSFRELSITIPNSGATEMVITLLEATLALTHKRPSYQPTGAHPSPRSASV